MACRKDNVSTTTPSRSWLGSALKIWPGMPGHYKSNSLVGVGHARPISQTYERAFVQAVSLGSVSLRIVWNGDAIQDLKFAVATVFIASIMYIAGPADVGDNSEIQ